MRYPFVIAMKKSCILNSALSEAVASLGHTEYLVICDAGLPIPDGTKKIDLSISHGVPSFDDVLKAVCSELVVESYIVASEIQDKNVQELESIRNMLSGMNEEMVSHTKFKELSQRARYIVRTGETKPYANVILVGGVNF